jgi:hypothetical protein
MRRLRREVLERAAGRSTPTVSSRARGRSFARVLAALAAFALMGLGLSSLWQRWLAPSGVRLASSASSRFSEENDRDHRIVRIVEGTFDFDVRPSADGRKLLVIVPDGEIEDIGTKFRVVVEAGRTVEVSVSEGEVEVRREGHAPERLVAGMTFRPRSAPSAAASASVPASTPPSGPSTAASSASTSELAPASPRRVSPSPPAAGAPARIPDAVTTSRAPARVGSPSTDAIAVASAPAPSDESIAPPNVRVTGEEAEDAAYLAFVRAVRAGHHPTARRIGLDYLARYPAGFRAKDVATTLAAFPPGDDGAANRVAPPGTRR